MDSQTTARLLPRNEHHKARLRLLLLGAVSLIGPPLSGVHSALLWIFYLAFVLAYSLWTLRLTSVFHADNRLGFLLSLTDFAILLPLFAWNRHIPLRVAIAVLWVSGFAITARIWSRGERRQIRGTRLVPVDEDAGVAPELGGLEAAVRTRMRLFATSGASFSLVLVQLVRFEETAFYYGDLVAQNALAAVTRRAMRLLGTDAQHFHLPGGRIAFLFSGSTEDAGSVADMVGRKVGEHLVDGRRIECLVGVASAPADGLDADELLQVAEEGAFSTAAFRRVASAHQAFPERAKVAAG
jgi:GGDEF domain-containing protein